MLWLPILASALAADVGRSSADAVTTVLAAAGHDRGASVAVVAIPDSDQLGVLPPDLTLRAADAVASEFSQRGFTRVVGSRDVARLLVAWRLTVGDLSAHADLCEALAAQMGVERIAWVHISQKDGTDLQLALGLPSQPLTFLGTAMVPL